MMEFLVRIDIDIPLDTPPERKQELLDAEAARARELMAAGVIVRIWRLPGRTANVGVWAAPDATALHEVLTSLPLFPYFTTQVEALAVHYLEAPAG
jgi:muconolactone D-isomerase